MEIGPTGMQATDQKLRLLNTVYDVSQGDTHHPVHPARLVVPGLTREDIQTLIERLSAEGLVEIPHRDGYDIYLTPKAVKYLTAAEGI